jgi:L-iditol 2-dehydrogenase
VWEEALFLARPGGQVVLFGGCPPGTSVSLDTYRLHYDQVRVFSPFHFTPQAVRQAYELLTSGKIPAKQLISGTYPLAQLPYAFALLQRGEGIKYAVIP